MEKINKNGNNTRREFIKQTGAAMVGTAIALNFSIPKSAIAMSSKTLKVGLIGCGGRGTGAAFQALSADKDVVLTAMADVFPDHLEESLANLMKDHGDKVKIDSKNKFIGFDAYKKVMESDVDVVILTTPPCFRPAHFEAAVAAGKHIFCEKPVAVDSPGLKRVLEAAHKAKEKNLSVVSGLCWRYHTPKRETFSRIIKGDIGKIQSVYTTYNTGELWSRPWQPGWSDLEKKMRNWLYYSWLSGDHIVEQAIHSIDMGSWALNDVKPLSATGTGGRQVRTEEIYGNIFDHFAIEYEYENGVKAFHFSRQQKDCSRAYSCEVIGTKGSCIVDVNKPGGLHEILGENPWRYRGEDNDMYQQEHDELFASIRNNKPIYDGDRMVHSNALAIMGRMVAYTGQTITYDEVINSKEVQGPNLDEYNWDLKFDGPMVAMPEKQNSFKDMNRKEFIKKQPQTIALAALAPSVAGKSILDRSSNMKPAIKLALKFSMVEIDNMSILDKFQMLKDIGYDGTELDSPNNFDNKEILKARDKTGLNIPSVICSKHWNSPLSSPDPKVRAECVEAMKTALKDCKEYGGTSVLLVPAVVNKDMSYNDAYTRSQEEIRKLLPLAKETGVKIAVENVWNNFLLSPLEAARYIDEFNDPMIGWHFDIGNIVRYGWPEQWIRVLSKRILKLDVKEYSRKKESDEGVWKGFNAELTEGDNNWPEVLKALDDIGYSGWASAEVDGGDRKRMEHIYSGLCKIFK